MTQREREAMQSVLALEAIAKLHAVTALFGVEDGYRRTDADVDAFAEWSAKVAALEAYVWNESPIA